MKVNIHTVDANNVVLSITHEKKVVAELTLNEVVGKVSADCAVCGHLHGWKLNLDQAPDEEPNDLSEWEKTSRRLIKEGTQKEHSFLYQKGTH